MHFYVPTHFVYVCTYVFVQFHVYIIMYTCMSMGLLICHFHIYRIRTMAIKFMEIVILAQTPKEQVCVLYTCILYIVLTYCKYTQHA